MKAENSTISDRNISDREPRLMWQEFQAISNIPRCTGAEAAVLAYISRQAGDRGFETRSDAAGNLLVHLPPTPGCDQVPGMVIQGHVDMVCEQNMGTGHDFGEDPIRLEIDGGWLRAEGTTLGADNGIAVAMMLALIKGDYAHGPLELLFTLDEEGGLIGALKLDPAMLGYRRMINLDSEEEGIFYIGCAGGMETAGSLPLDWEAAPAGLLHCRLTVTGLGGGHSGTEIHRQPGNSLVLAGRLLHELPADTLRLSAIFGGDRHNAVPREAVIDFLLPESAKATVEEILRNCEQDFRREFAASKNNTEENLAIIFKLQDAKYPSRVLTAGCQKKLSQLLLAIPHGVLSMSRVIDGLVAASTNFASIRITDGNLQVLTSQRSDVQSLIDDAGRRVAAPFFLAGGSAHFAREYPGWQPNPDSALLQAALEAWEEEHGKKGRVMTIHAGLECGVIGAKFDSMDMISFGPDITGAHTPEEAVNIDSCRRVFEFLLKLLVK